MGRSSGRRARTLALWVGICCAAVGLGPLPSRAADAHEAPPDRLPPQSGAPGGRGSGGRARRRACAHRRADPPLRPRRTPRGVPGRLRWPAALYVQTYTRSQPPSPPSPPETSPPGTSAEATSVPSDRFNATPRVRISPPAKGSAATGPGSSARRSLLVLRTTHDRPRPRPFRASGTPGATPTRVLQGEDLWLSVRLRVAARRATRTTRSRPRHSRGGPRASTPPRTPEARDIQAVAYAPTVALFVAITEASAQRPALMRDGREERRYTTRVAGASRTRCRRGRSAAFVVTSHAPRATRPDAHARAAPTPRCRWSEVPAPPSQLHPRLSLSPRAASPSSGRLREPRALPPRHGHPRLRPAH